MKRCTDLNETTSSLCTGCLIEMKCSGQHLRSEIVK